MIRQAGFYTSQVVLTLHTMAGVKRNRLPSVVSIDDNDVCETCGADGLLIFCDNCAKGYHGYCVGVHLTLQEVEVQTWYCSKCANVQSRSDGDDVVQSLPGHQEMGGEQELHDEGVQHKDQEQDENRVYQQSYSSPPAPPPNHICLMLAS